MMILAQISDLHILEPGKKLSGMIDTAACLSKAVLCIGRLNPQPDALLITGDLVNVGSIEEYEHLRTLLSPLKMPIYLIPGNHDNRDMLRKVFPKLSYLPTTGALHYTIETLPVRIIALDTTVPGKGSGALDDAALAWLATRLNEAPKKPTLIMMHHPPFATGIEFMDVMGLNDGVDEFARLITSHSNVERILCGHVHRAVEARVGNAVAMICPATCHQIPLALSTEDREGFTLEPPGFRLHLWNGKQLISHSATIGDFPGPYRFA